MRRKECRSRRQCCSLRLIVSHRGHGGALRDTGWLKDENHLGWQNKRESICSTSFTSHQTFLSKDLQCIPFAPSASDDAKDPCSLLSPHVFPESERQLPPRPSSPSFSTLRRGERERRGTIRSQEGGGFERCKRMRRHLQASILVSLAPPCALSKCHKGRIIRIVCGQAHAGGRGKRTHTRKGEGVRAQIRAEWLAPPRLLGQHYYNRYGVGAGRGVH